LDGVRASCSLGVLANQQETPCGASVIHEHLYVSLFPASAETLASENASRLVAMQFADLGAKFHRLRQSGIDEELFDVVAGFDALSPQARQLR
jgi:F0F1-type ATP synthase gamma subunit